MLCIRDVDLSHQRVLIREDFNVPMLEGRITDTSRLEAALETIEYALTKGAKIILMSHLGRPQEGEFDGAYSLAPVAEYLSQRLETQVKLVSMDFDTTTLNPRDIVLLENVRFLKGESKNDPVLAQKMASLCDVFVMDAFAVSHREQASTAGVIQHAKTACAGFLLEKELISIEKALRDPVGPVVAIVGGSKISTKLKVLEHLLPKVDTLVVGGAMANTFLAATGIHVGASLYEPDLLDVARGLLAMAKEKHKHIWLPIDVTVANEIAPDASCSVKMLDEIESTDKIADFGPHSIQALNEVIAVAGTILWNGPVGVFEMAPFAKGTAELANMIAHSRAFTLAGGGDTLAAIHQFKVANDISYLSTGGGAFLEMLEGKTLPCVALLQAKERVNS